MANDQKTVFITGCSSGIGQHLALEFKAQGYRVFATARKAESLSELASHGIEPMSLTVDDTASVEACYQELRTKLGPGKGLDYLVNNAGRNYTVPGTDVDLAEVHATFTTNLFAVVHINQTFLPLLLRARGTIVHTGSIAGIFPYPFGSIYNASKAALHHYAATLRLELAPFGVHVLNVVTGGVRSNIARTQRELPPGSVMRPFEREYRNRLTHSQQVGMDTAAFAREVVQGVVACRGRWWNANEVWAGAKASQVYWGRWVDGLIPGGLWRLILPRMFGIDRSVSYEELPESKKDI